jgi:hypothetical protein
MSRFTKLMILVLTICLCAAAVSAQPDPIVITSGQLNETRTDTTLTMFGPGSLTVSLEIPNPSWFGIQQPGKLVNLTGGGSVPFTGGTLMFGGTTYSASSSAPILFEYTLNTPTFPLVFGSGTPFALQGTLSDGFGGLDVTGGGTISIADEALTFGFQQDPPPVPAPTPEPATLLLVATGLAVARMNKVRMWQRHR